jgi:VanZ family protein
MNYELRTAMKKFIIYWLPPLIWMVIIFPSNDYLSSESTSYIIVPLLQWLLPHASQSTIDMLHITVRKFAHFFNYAFLAFLLYRAFRAGNSKVWRPEWIVFAGLIGVVYGSLDEYMQTFIPSRTGSVYDWIIDFSGAIFALGTLSVRNRLKTGFPAKKG